ncbi:AraC family transcriptional regulator [Dyadobacter subterraneus]|uniref:Helix-turn-helix domain-containing protein n=1 Tax=Dyadobacter subterraneus TaxID=2773304 RepID=A0ABR9WAI0_9BACT|nr:AraC family transcriptional regulator [Dyadobacter subterraneus]MBE9462491.1 helix-turn-helix domain-containing protein [Dyadobacter subterraneus]
MIEVYREITPLTQYDCFTIFTRKKKSFDFPLHNHDEFELNLILGGKGVKRIVGDHTETIDDAELVLVGNNLPHGWFTNQYKWEEGMPEVEEITLQFHRDLFDDKLLRRNQLFFIRSLLDKSVRGISFSKETIERIMPRLMALTQKSGFDSMLELMSILHDLSVSRNMKVLSNSTFTDENINFNSRRIEKVFAYMRDNYDKEITLEGVAKLAGMTEVSFSRFIKKRTGKTFIESLNEIRLGHTSRSLIDTTNTISEIAYKCGFNNLSYFNRIFKNKNGCTPKEFRENYAGTRTFV